MAIPTVATQVFLNLNVAQAVDPNYVYGFAYQRALKVFMVSFVEYESLCPQLFQQKFAEYNASIEEIYNIQTQDMPGLIAALQQTLAIQRIEVQIAIIRFKGRHQVTNPRMVVNNGFAQSNQIQLDVNSEVQIDVNFVRNIPYHQYREQRQQNNMIGVRLEADNWVQNTDKLNEFEIPYRSIHAEGFEDWFDFGRGVQLLIKIEFRIVNETHITAENVSKFHFHTIHMMVSRRLEDYRAQENTSGTGHKIVTNKSSISYIRKRIDPNSEEAFWKTPTTDLLTGIRGVGANALTHRSLRTTKYSDLQIGIQFHYEFEDSVCLCSEWCNWNAFFHFNPIYRFILVQHNQIYMQNRTNIPDMYMFLTTYAFFEAGSDPNNIEKAPLVHLMDCSNEYRKKYSEEFFYRIPGYPQLYGQSRPRIGIIQGLTYNFLRYHRNLPHLCIQSDPNPFADISIDHMMTCYKIMSDLHKFLATPPFIPQGNGPKREWFKELDQISREQFKKYIKVGYDNQMTIRGYNYDYLFSEDYEYSNVLSKTEGEREVRRIRETIFKVTTPFNLRFMCNEFVMTFVSINKFIGKVEPMLPTTRRRRAIEDMAECLLFLDRDLNIYNSNPNNPKPLKFFIPEDIAKRGFDSINKHFIVFYSLRLYCIGSRIQSYCISAIIKFYELVDFARQQIFSRLVFIFKNQIIETTFKTLYPNHRLFLISDEIRHTIEDFYENFWGRAAHELAVIPDLVDNIASGFHQYNRLYFWWNNNGNERLRFRRIFDTFGDNFEENISQSEAVLKDYIISGVQGMNHLKPSYEYYTEILDYLVYYLVKANAYMIVCSVAKFLEQFYNLISEPLLIRHVCFVLSKPGWVQVFRSMKTAMNYINRVKTLYIVFDDEFNRISETLSQTKGLIKEIYRHFYRKIFHEWWDEINFIYDRIIPDPTTDFIQLHLALGISLMAAVVDHFREETRKYRNLLKNQFAIVPDPMITHQAIFNACEPIYQKYLRDRPAIDYAQPFCTMDWQIHLYTTFRRFDQNVGQLNIDLTQADI